MLSRWAYSKLNVWPLQNASNITSLNSSNSFMWLTGNTISLVHARTTGKRNLCNGFFVKQSWLNLTDILKLPVLKGLWLCPVTHFKKPARLILAFDSLAEVSSSVSYAEDSMAPEIFSASITIKKPCKWSSIFSSTEFQKLPSSEKVGSTKGNTWLIFTAVSKELINRLLSRVLFSISVSLIPKRSRAKEEIHLNTKFSAMKYLPFLHLQYYLHFQH